jgi:hypothetical protein
MTKYVAIGVVVLIIAAAVYAYMSSAAGTPAEGGGEPMAMNEEAEVAAPEEGGTFTGTFSDLAGRGGAWQCAVDASNQFAESQGIVFVSGGKIRGDFTSRVSVQGFNQSVESHMIQRDGAVYVWTSLTSQGFKTDAEAGSPDGTTKPQGQGMDLNQEYTYDCAPWSKDDSVFALPAGVVFAE